MATVAPLAADELKKLDAWWAITRSSSVGTSQAATRLPVRCNRLATPSGGCVCLE